MNKHRKTATSKKVAAVTSPFKKFGDFGSVSPMDSLSVDELVFGFSSGFCAKASILSKSNRVAFLLAPLSLNCAEFLLLRRL